MSATLEAQLAKLHETTERVIAGHEQQVGLLRKHIANLETSAREKDAAIAAMRPWVEALARLCEPCRGTGKIPKDYAPTGEVECTRCKPIRDALDGTAAAALLAELERLRGENEKLRTLEEATRLLANEHWHSYKTTLGKLTAAEAQAALLRSALIDALIGEGWDDDDAPAWVCECGELAKTPEEVKHAPGCPLHSDAGRDLLSSAAALRSRVKTLEDRLREFHREEDGIDINHVEERDGVEGIARWVTEYKARLAREGGGMFDSGLRCVSEGGQVFYVDPEEIEALVARVKTLEGALRQVEGNRRFEYLGEEIQGVVRAALSTAPVETR